MRVLAARASLISLVTVMLELVPPYAGEGNIHGSTRFPSSPSGTPAAPRSTTSPQRKRRKWKVGWQRPPKKLKVSYLWLTSFNYCRDAESAILVVRMIALDAVHGEAAQSRIAPAQPLYQRLSASRVDKWGFRS